MHRIPRDLNRTTDWRVGRDKLLNGFIGHALGSCLDYESYSLPAPGGGGSVDMEDLPFDLEENSGKVRTNSEPYAQDILVGAQSRHKIFHDEFVVKAFYEAEKAHKGQVNCSCS